MIDTLAGLFSLLVVVVFLAYYEMVIASLPLGFIIIGVIGLAAHDFYESMLEGNNNASNNTSP